MRFNVHVDLTCMYYGGKLSVKFCGSNVPVTIHEEAGHCDDDDENDHDEDDVPGETLHGNTNNNMHM